MVLLLVVNQVRILCLQDLTNMENKTKHLIDLRLSMQRALLGAIYPEIRKIAVSWASYSHLKVIVYLDREPNDFDRENLSIVTAEICADFPEITELEELCVFSTERMSKLDGLDWVVYARKESE